jgi:hypothetical protein
MQYTFNYGGYRNLDFVEVINVEQKWRWWHFSGFWRRYNFRLDTRLEFLKTYLFYDSKYAPWKEEVFRWGPAVGGTTRHDWAPTRVKLGPSLEQLPEFFGSKTYFCKRCMVYAKDEFCGSGPDVRFDKFEEVSCDFLVVYRVLKQ